MLSVKCPFVTQQYKQKEQEVFNINIPLAYQPASLVVPLKSENMSLPENWVSVIINSTFMKVTNTCHGARFILLELVPILINNKTDGCYNVLNASCYNVLNASCYNVLNASCYNELNASFTMY